MSLIERGSFRSRRIPATPETRKQKKDPETVNNSHLGERTDRENLGALATFWTTNQRLSMGSAEEV